MVDPFDPTRRKVFPAEAQQEDLLVPAMRQGKRTHATPDLREIQARGKAQLARFHAGIKRFVFPHQYPVGLERGLQELRTKLVLEARGLSGR
jgi:nicotinate phosphoribosyltransferase